MLVAIMRGSSALIGRPFSCGMLVTVVVGMQPSASGRRRVIADQHVCRPGHALQRQAREQQVQHQIADSNQHAGASVTNNEKNGRKCTISFRPWLCGSGRIWTQADRQDRRSMLSWIRLCGIVLMRLRRRSGCRVRAHVVGTRTLDDEKHQHQNHHQGHILLRMEFNVV